jgi:hypothetical protein
MKSAYTQGRILGQINVARIALETALRLATASGDKLTAAKVRKVIAVIA